MIKKKLTPCLHVGLVVIRKEEVPDLSPLHLGRRPARALPAEKLGRSRPVDPRLGVVVGNVAHELAREALVVAQGLARVKVAAAPVAGEGGGAGAAVLLDNVLAQLGKLWKVGHGARVVLADVEAGGVAAAKGAREAEVLVGLAGRWPGPFRGKAAGGGPVVVVLGVTGGVAAAAAAVGAGLFAFAVGGRVGAGVAGEGA